ncbi:M48 family metallopeptidase [Pacificispira sp.]|jgi:hypothetical protein|uniref:M48 family metallopeptidase n=1 Tax=Pacificispira sp. TaxID=2888761 RepID=UPI003B518975
MGFFRNFASRAPEGPRETERTVDLNGRRVDIVLRRHPRARRIKLTVDASQGRPVLTLPPGVPEREALRFLDRNAGWTLKALDRLPDRLDFAPDGIVPYRGEDHRIVHNPDARGLVRAEDGALIVTGGAEHLSRRLTDFLKKQARAEIRPLALERAAALGRKPGRISIRDQRTRWGSCAANGDLSFSWRLILAPPEILDYVVSHEVAHLVHMDHSPAFWRAVASVYPEYRAARDWLGTEGARLHRIG